MSEVTLTVRHPTKTVPPAQAVKLASWRAVYKLQSAPDSAWQPASDPIAIAAGEATATSKVTNVPDGDYDFGAIWTDTDGQDSDKKVTQLHVVSGGAGPVLPPRPDVSDATIVAAQTA